MKPFRLRLLLPTLSIALALGACQSTGNGGGTAAAIKPPPPNVRSLIARQLTSDYISSGIGPATISEIKPGGGLFGTGKHVLEVRYPVKDRGLFAGEGATTTRCIDITVGEEADGQISIRTARSRQDGEGCYGSAPTANFTELSQIGHRVTACKARGEAPCLLSHTGMSEAEARRLMKAR
jgi:hypothetical protein